jgi:predicted RNase H-like nuclease
MNKNYYGVDGCKSGWCCASYIEGKININLFSSIEELTSSINSKFKIWIDIPIGLGSINKPRTIDQLLRSHLTSFKQSVFNSPTRKAVYANSYSEAKELNIAETTKSLSIQSWNITPKIKDLDTYLLNNKSQIDYFEESHPELCFKQLNNGLDLKFSKHKKDGIEERLYILKMHETAIYETFNSTLKKYSRKLISKDDILDSLGLLISQKVKRKTNYLSADIITDEEKIPMRIAYPSIKK